MFYHTFFLLIAIFIYGCGSPLFKMQLPPGVGNTFRSGKMQYHLYGKTGTSVMEYRVEQNSAIFCDFVDTPITLGLIFPRLK